MDQIQDRVVTVCKYTGIVMFDLDHSTITYLFTTQSRLVTTLKKEPFESILGKGENAGYSFSQIVFYPSQKKFQFFSNIYFVVCKCFEFGPVYDIVVW